MVGAIVVDTLPDLAPGSLTSQLVAQLLGSQLLPGDHWTVDRRPSAAARIAVAEAMRIEAAPRADVGTALPALASTVAAALAALRAQHAADWHGWLIAAPSGAAGAGRPYFKSPALPNRADT